MNARRMNEGCLARARDRRVRGFRLAAIFVLALGVVLGAGTALAEGWGYDLGDELMSPFCPGRTLASCPSPQAAELIQWIVTQEAAGVSREQVLEILIERHGEEILGAPPARGITLWAYIFPVAGFLLFGGIALFALKRIVGGRAPTAPASAAAGPTSPLSPATGPPASEAELARLVDAELARRR